jgi:prenyltransferase beta subunit
MPTNFQASRAAAYAAVLLSVLYVPTRAAEAEPQMDGPTRKAVAKSLEWLAAKQNPDGSWSDPKYPHNTAITSFALLAFLSQGHLPDQGLYGQEIAKGSRFLISSSRPTDGYLIGSRAGNMYCHAMSTLALSQLWGMTGDRELRRVLERAVELIVRCQSPEGGWRYEPQPTGADISVTIMQVMALRAAKSSGLYVPDDTLRRALTYINNCRDPASGGYRYQPESREPGFARTAAGVCVLQLSGQYSAAEIPKAIEYLKKNFNSQENFWYGHYYAAHAMHQVGGKDWREWYERISKLLLTEQSQGGDWARSNLDLKSAGPVYQTAIATIILSVPAQYLPVFQN